MFAGDVVWLAKVSFEVLRHLIVPDRSQQDWWKYVVYEDPDYDFTGFGLDDILAAEALDPSQISTFSGEFSEFAARGGKFLSYHGTHDNVIDPCSTAL